MDYKHWPGMQNMARNCAADKEQVMTEFEQAAIGALESIDTSIHAMGLVVIVGLAILVAVALNARK